MPREIVTLDGKSFRFREYDLPPPGPEDVRVRVRFAAPKHGTELHSITGSVFDRRRWDPELRLFVERDGPPDPPRERAVGNTVVGEVAETGAAVETLRPGDAVFGYGPIREVHQAPAERWRRLGDLTPVDAVCADPGHVALVAVRDGNVRVGDVVAVFGLGAIGLLAVQTALAAGASTVFALDPLPARRERASRDGAVALDPMDGDSALAIRQATEGRGADVVLETSGSARALNEAIRTAGQCGTVVHVPWGPEDAAGLSLAGEYHLNRINIVGSQAVWSNPDRSHPLWDEERCRLAVIDLFRRQVLTGDGIVTPIVSFEEAPDALRDILAHPDRTIKMGVRLST